MSTPLNHPVWLSAIVAAAVLFVAQGCDPAQARAAESGHKHEHAKTAAASPYDKPGFTTAVKDGRLWVFKAGSDEAKAFRKDGKTPAKHAVRPAAGPAGMTIRSPDAADITAYLMARPGFVAVEADGRFWIYREGSDDYAAYQKKGSHPAKHAVRPGAGPGGITLRSVESETISEYLGTKPGFSVYAVDGRLWVYETDSDDHKAYLAKGSHPAKHVVRPGAGPGGMTLRAVEGDVLTAYAVAQEGFITAIDDGRLWVFPAHSDDARSFINEGKKPAKHAVRPGAGPMGMTVRAVELDHIIAYRRAAGLE